jgi:hypothetical protein
MYTQKDVFPQSEGMNDKTYFRRLVGRVNRLKEMIQFRNTTKMGKAKMELREVDEQIKKLQLKKEQLKYEISLNLQEMNNIYSEISEYQSVIKGMLEKGYELQIHINYKEKVNKKTGKVYYYYEGRVRMGIRKGFSMKDKFYQFGNHKDCVQLIKEMFDVEISTEHSRKSQYEVIENLKKLIIERWLKDLISVDLI